VGAGPIFADILTGRHWGVVGAFAGAVLGSVVGIILAGMPGFAADAAITRLRPPGGD
jgi:outer membrane lipoprotein SlyB